MKSQAFQSEPVPISSFISTLFRMKYIVYWESEEALGAPARTLQRSLLHCPLVSLLSPLVPSREEHPQYEQQENDKDDDHPGHDVDGQVGSRGGRAGGGDQVRAIEVSHEHCPHQAQPLAPVVLQDHLCLRVILVGLRRAFNETKCFRFWTLAGCVWQISLECVCFCF